MTMRVAVIGAGASGLTAIKCCLDEGLQPVCYERTGEMGGLWNYKDEVIPGQGSVMKSTVINTSKEMMCYSDFPIPAEYPIYMPNTYVQKYLLAYAQQFNLAEYVKFKTEVLHIQKHAEFDSNGQWTVKVHDTITGLTETVVYDAVLICTGHHAEIHKPTFPGLDRFQGSVIHSHDYRRPHGYDDKRVVIIGIGNSGGDMAVELSRVASQVFLSTRRGTWIWNRIGDNGLPIDMRNLNRCMIRLAGMIPNLSQKVVQYKMNQRFDHSLYSIKPEFNVLSQHPMVNDDLPNRIVTGSVVVKSNVESFTENGVYFDDGTFEDDISMVFLATGYKFGFPFLDKSVLDVKNNEVELYKYMFPLGLKHNTLAVIGCVQPFGALMPICELQCRLATRVFKGDVKLPSEREMQSDIELKKTRMADRFVQTQRHTIQVDYIPFMDELAELCGCQPNLPQLLLKDPKLFMKCVFGPCTSYQFRLNGPGTWAGARRAIMTQWDRTFQPLRTRKVAREQRSNLGFLFFYLVFVSIFMLVLSICL